MASAAPSSLASSVEKTNGAKLSRLLIDGGTRVLRSIFDGHHPPASLSAAFAANYLTLNNLLKRRVLHRPQWDLLFPPSGAPPDSQTFDITLLFLLLTNICGLSPPHSGWHTKPPLGDISLEANLARIKFYRNVLYGHVSTTGIDTPKFSVLWQDISAVLVTLGLNQAEINRLKAEHCGEEDYIDALLEWADSEEDIKSQLRDIRHVQTKVQQIVGDVRQTQLEDHEAIQEGKAKLEEVQTNLQQTLSNVRQSQLEGHEILQQSHAKLEEARRTQLGDSRAIHDTKSTVEEVCKRLQNLEEESQQNIEDFKGEKERLRSDEILTKLTKIDTSSDIRHHANRYVEGTRLPIFADVERWLDDKSSPNRVMVISGSAGMGKSVISAVLCRKMIEAGRLSGSHFCQHNKARHRNPKVMLQSLACQLSDSLPEYKNALLKRLSRNLGVDVNDMEVGELFELLFEEPLLGLNDPDSIHLMVIDGLDESEYHGRNEMLDVIADYFKTLPRWIRFLVTTRPEINISERLQDLNPIQLKPDCHDNLKDIRICFKEQLKHVLQLGCQETILEKLVEKSEGVMLYMYYLTDFIKENARRMSPDELVDSGLPSGISSVYQVYFKRLKTELEKEVGITEVQFFDFLNAIVAAKEPLPVDFVYKLFLSGEWSSAGQKKVRDATDCISALLPIEDECIHFFHKSVKDWLIEKSSSRQKKLTVDERQCHRILSKLCTEELDGVKLKGIHSAKFKDTTMYALQYGVQHILEVEENARPCSLEEVVKKYVLDLELVYAKLCVNSAAAAEDVLCVQEQKSINKRALGTLLFLLRKHISTLTELPHAIFQTLLNEGGSELSCEALSLLNSKYSDIPYMEYLQKKDPQAAVQMRFYGSGHVVCFDVSPNLDYMVCECRDETLHLWSLRTAKQLWKRAVEVPNIYQYAAYTIELLPSTWLLYRSVVFHPNLNLILPGILSQGYTIAGDLKPLFVTSKCRFQICSISGDKTTILTDCLENKRCIIQWSLNDGTEITRFTHKKEILSFAWSPDGRLIAISDSACCISLVDAVDGFKTLVQTYTSEECGMLKFTPDCQFLFGLPISRGKCGILTRDDKLLCFDVKRDTVAEYYFCDFPEKHSRYTREFESCNECGFLSGDPFWYPFATRFNYLDSAEFALVLNKQFVLAACPCSNVIEMFSLSEIRERRGELSDEAKQRADLGDLPEQRVELDNVAEQRAKINDLLVQETELGDLLEQGVGLNDLPEQRVEFGDLPEQTVESDDLPEQTVELDDLPEQGVEVDDLTEQGVEVDDLTEQGVELYDLPEQGVELDDLPEQGVELDDLPEQGVEIDDLTEQGVERDDLPEQGAELDDLPEQGVGLDDLTEQRAVHAYLEEQSAELHHPPEERAKVDYQPEQGDQLGDQSELRVELDDLSEQGPAAFDDLLEWRAARYNLAELDEPDVLEHQGTLLEDLEEKSFDEVCDQTIESTVDSVVFSVNGDTLYVVMGATIQRINLITWDISSKKYKGERGFLSNVRLFPVKRGVLCQRSNFSLELWSSELSECIQSWTGFYFFQVAPISEELVALERWHFSKMQPEVVILDTTSGDIVSTIENFDGRYLACNSKCEVLTKTSRNSLQLRRDDIVLWDNSLPSDLRFFDLLVVFSPTDRFVVISGNSELLVFRSDTFGVTLYVFDTVSGRALHILCSVTYTLSYPLPSCEFVSDDECVVTFRDKSRGSYLRLYNAKSGELLSEIVDDREVRCLAASPIKRLVAIGFKNSKNFEIIQVMLPGDKERRNNNRFELRE